MLPSILTILLHAIDAKHTYNAATTIGGMVLAGQYVLAFLNTWHFDKDQKVQFWSTQTAHIPSEKLKLGFDIFLSNGFLIVAFPQSSAL